jgi:Spy/CpxP family protein refolding chaperone
MKKMILLTVCVLLCTPIFAQSPQGGQRLSPEEMAARNTEWMTKELNLTAEQKTSVDSINLLYAKAQQILFQSFEGERDKIREAMTALNEEKEKALTEILTAEQLKAYKDKASQRMNERRRR